MHWSINSIYPTNKILMTFLITSSYYGQMIMVKFAIESQNPFNERKLVQKET